MSYQRQPWTTTEEAILRTHYPGRGGCAICHERLPHRTKNAIIEHARRLGLRSQKLHSPPKLSNDLLDAAIRRLYTKPLTMRDGTMAAFCKTWDRTRQWVHRRAKHLGCAPKRIPSAPWLPEEDALLESCASMLTSMEGIARRLQKAGYMRTPSSVICRLTLLGISRRDDPDLWTANDLARCMGVDAKAVIRWITHHGLTADRSAMGSPDKPFYVIRRKDLRAWLIRSAEWDHRRCDRAWLVDILAGANTGALGRMEAA